VKAAVVTDTTCLIGLERIGRLAVLVKARRSGLLSALTPVLDDLEKNGFFIAPPLRAEALRLAGE
jgi:predicted nucleic acid-binding protein